MNEISNLIKLEKQKVEVLVEFEKAQQIATNDLRLNHHPHDRQTSSPDEIVWYRFTDSLKEEYLKTLNLAFDKIEL